MGAQQSKSAVRPKASRSSKSKQPAGARKPFPFLQLPQELRLMVYEQHFTAKELPFRRITAIFYVCKQIYREAQPVFLSQCLFTITPLRQPLRLPDGWYVRSGLLDILRSGDDDSDDFLNQIEWKNAVIHEFSRMFRRNWAPPPQYHRYAKDVKHRNAAWKPWAHMSRFMRWPSTQRYLAREPREVMYYYNLNDRPWNAHGIIVACDMIRHNKFVNGLRKLGRHKCAKLKHLRILWGGDEADVSGIVVGYADSISIILTSLLIRTWLPNISHITLQKRRPRSDEELYENWDTSDVESPEVPWPARPSVYLPEELKASILSRRGEGGDFVSIGYTEYSLRIERSFIRAVDYLVDACPNVSISSPIRKASLRIRMPLIEEIIVTRGAIRTLAPAHW
jgi:hypothetical protein